jgi:predicted aminopeptidase
VRLLFHELAHQVVYAQGDTLFNEFATAVERLGTERWLATQARPEVRQAFAASEERRQSFRALTRARAHGWPKFMSKKGPSARQSSAECYEIRSNAGFSRPLRCAARALAGPGRARGRLRPLGGPGQQRQLCRPGRLRRLVPAFEALFAQQGQRWDAFYDAVRHLAALPQDERHARLQALLPPPHQGD